MATTGRNLRSELIRSGFLHKVGSTPPYGIADWTMNVDGSVTPVVYEFGPSPAEAWIIDELLVQILTSTSVITDSDFGDINALTNGADAGIVNDSGPLVAFTGGFPLKANNDFAALGFVALRNQYSSLPKGVTGRFLLGTRADAGILLDGSRGDRVQVVVNDDLTDLVRVTTYVSATLSIK